MRPETKLRIMASASLTTTLLGVGYLFFSQPQTHPIPGNLCRSTNSALNCQLKVVNENGSGVLEISEPGLNYQIPFGSIKAANEFIKEKEKKFNDKDFKPYVGLGTLLFGLIGATTGILSFFVKKDSGGFQRTREIMQAANHLAHKHYHEE